MKPTSTDSRHPLVVELPDRVAPIAEDPLLIGRNAARLEAKLAAQEQAEPDGEPSPPRRTLTLGAKATADLLSRMRPLVYANGQCSDCGHSDEEKRAIGEALLSWWSQHNIDEMDGGRTE